MNTTAFILIAAAVIVIAVAAFFAYREWRTRKLRRQFGPEYIHAVRQYGSEARAQDALAARASRMEKVHIRSLTHEDRERLLRGWEAVQRGFVDDPAGSIRAADSLVNQVMRARGYPMAEWERVAENLSVDHPLLVQNYRLAHSIAERHARGDAGTEELRQSLVHYRELFDELLETQTISGRRRS